MNQSSDRRVIVTAQVGNLLSNYRKMSEQTFDECAPPAKKPRLNGHYLHHHLPRVAVVVPIMADRLPSNTATYKNWIMNGFDIIFVFTEDQETTVMSVLEQHDPNLKASIKLHTYTRSSRPNAGIAKDAAYRLLTKYLDRSDFMYAILLDDTVNNIFNTCSEVSIMTSPTEFCRVVERYATESTVFGGTVAANRHPQRCHQEGVNRVKGGFIQQAVVFSCRGTPTLSNHFRDTNEYVSKMQGLRYRHVPFGEDVCFQISLYENGVLVEKKSAQFWGIGVSRNEHKSATKQPFEEMEDTTKEKLKEMILYLRDQDILITNRKTKILTGIRVIPGGPVCIHIKGKLGERPWRDAYNYALHFSETQKPNI